MSAVRRRQRVVSAALGAETCLGGQDGSMWEGTVYGAVRSGVEVATATVSQGVARRHGGKVVSRSCRAAWE